MRRQPCFVSLRKQAISKQWLLIEHRPNPPAFGPEAQLDGRRRNVQTLLGPCRALLGTALPVYWLVQALDAGAILWLKNIELFPQNSGKDVTGKVAHHLNLKPSTNITDCKEEIGERQARLIVFPHIKTISFVTRWHILLEMADLMGFGKHCKVCNQVSTPFLAAFPEPRSC
eukprot:1159360-Pelagomonas_calceolata.AAC.1